MKLVSWNVAGIKACIKKGLFDFVQKEQADAYCFQEVKASPKDTTITFPGYHSHWQLAEKNGYSGLLTLTKNKPLSITQGLGEKTIDAEGRVCTLEFDKFFLINAYFPHAHRELHRLPYKLRFNKQFETHCKKLAIKKPVIIAADFNVAHQEIDLRNPKQNQGNAGFTAEEREWLDQFLKSGYVDTFRHFVTEGGHYTWWTYRNNARQRNIGWRIDYLIVNKELIECVKESNILKDVAGSDHCPILLDIKL
ncbi:exodeoxyribonuclease III [Candidatus Woesearchaeota archaeon]|nr:exodeoxyribonuclease III [Candidatus Woesearchaeota archaeon]